MLNAVTEKGKVKEMTEHERKLERLILGSVPSDEKCAQLDLSDYYERVQIECKTYVRQLQRQFAQDLDVVKFKIMANRHDFGTYYDVSVVYDTESEISTVAAYRIENMSPEKWDKKAREELGLTPLDATMIRPIALTMSGLIDQLVQDIHSDALQHWCKIFGITYEESSDDNWSTWDRELREALGEAMKAICK